MILIVGNLNVKLYKNYKMEAQVNKNGTIINHYIPTFIDKNKLQKEQINDPDYRLKILEKLYGNKYPISCSKCHHCR
jgi:hypothetical protein